MPAPLNLCTDAWLPVLRRSGPAQIRLGDLTGAISVDPVLTPDWPRPDFRFATLEMLAGLLATACPPADEDAWFDWWEQPPSPDVLDRAFDRVASAFTLDGDGPRFLQDFEELVAGSEPVERLLIEAPGANATTKNTDLLVKRGRVAALGRPTAAMALYTFQSWAPAGGAGNRTGLRGGGPLVTLVAPQAKTTLWHLVWANVPVGKPAEASEFPLIFPWLAPTVLSNGGRGVTPDQAHPLQAWWGMPRRIRLDFAEADPPAPCDITGRPDNVRVTGWRQRPNGANYLAWGGRHPLTPHFRVKPGEELLPVHPQPGGIGYRHWLGLVTATRDELRTPAQAVAEWRQSRGKDAGKAHLLAAGYDMDNMKARAFVEAEMPLPGGGDPAATDTLARALVESANLVAGRLRGAVRSALFSPGTTVKPDADVLATARERLWAATETRFFDSLEEAAQEPAKEQDVRARWAKLLMRTALSLFDEIAPLSPEAGAAALRMAKARRNLLFALLGYGRDGAQLFGQLGLPQPESKARRAAA